MLVVFRQSQDEPDRQPQAPRNDPVRQEGHDGTVFERHSNGRVASSQSSASLHQRSRTDAGCPPAERRRVVPASNVGEMRRRRQNNDERLRRNDKKVREVVKSYFAGSEEISRIVDEADRIPRLKMRETKLPFLPYPRRSNDMLQVSLQTIVYETGAWL